MPSLRHETIVELFRHRPELAVTALSGLLGIALPPHERVRLEPAEHVELEPTEYRADNVVVLTEPGGVDVAAVVVEVQLGRDRHKRLTWPVYLANLRARLDCPVLLLVVCVDAGVARWCAAPIPIGHPAFVLTPLVLGPDRIPVPSTPDDAPAEVAVLAAMAHGAAHHHVLDVLATALATVEPDRAVLYARLVLAALPEAARHHLEELMATGTFEYQSDFTRRLVQQGRVEGLAEAKAADVLTVLDARGIAVPDDLRARIEGCRDLDRLDAMLRRAVTASSAADLDG